MSQQWISIANVDQIATMLRIRFIFLYDRTMVYKIKTYTNIGLQGYEIIVEADSNKSLPTIEIIGLPDTAIKESKERMRGTFRHCGISIPSQKIVLNLAPSDIRKEGTRFDVPMAVALLMLTCDGQIHDADLVRNSLFFWELGLDGEIKKIDGLLPSVLCAIKDGYKTVFVPADNSYELEYIAGLEIYAVSHFGEIRDHLLGHQLLTPITRQTSIEDLYAPSGQIEHDFAYIKGQLVAKRALCVAAAGLHNVLMVWSPGSGKTMLARALRSIIPPLGFDEVLEVSQIYSLVGKLTKETPLIVERPFRQVHHTASKVSIIGGGRNLTPGEVSLAHKGILFFDELPEFPRETLEVLRQPIEDQMIAISRVSGTVQYPANFMFVATMNPSPCGYYNDPEVPCKCSYHEIKRYQNKVSWPLLDRIDMILEIPRENLDKLLDSDLGESSATLRDKVLRARNRQKIRFEGTGLVANAHMKNKHIEEYIILDEPSKQFIKQVAGTMKLSPRVIHRTLKLARTIADLDDQDQVLTKHIAEALQYRNKTMFLE